MDVLGKKSETLGQEAQVPIYCIECIYAKTYDENLSAYSKNVLPNDFIL